MRSQQDQVSGGDSDARNADTKHVAGKRSRRRAQGASKVKTGCTTCKIRRVKCDEARPNCVRCTSTGRRCDGYGTQAVVQPLAKVSRCAHHSSARGGSIIIAPNLRSRGLIRKGGLSSFFAPESLINCPETLMDGSGTRFSCKQRMKSPPSGMQC